MCWAPRYCGPACRAEHWAAGAAGAARPVPHAAVCAVLARFGSLKCDADMESVLRMCLDALALLRQETEGPAEPMQGSDPSVGPPGSPAGAGAACVPHAGAHAAAFRAPVQGASAGLRAGTLKAAETSRALMGAPAPGPAAPAGAPCGAAGAAAGCAPCTGEHSGGGRRGHDPIIQGCESSVRMGAHGAASQGPDPDRSCDPSQHAEMHGAANPGPDPSHGPEPSRRPALRHADLLRLQDHSADLPPRDRADWLKALRFLSHALAAEGWPHLPVLGSGPWSGSGSDALCRAGTPAVEPARRARTAGCEGFELDYAAAAARMDPQALLGLVGRICTNNFGVFRACGEGRAHAPSAGPGPSCGALPGLGTCGPGVHRPASGLPVQQSGHTRGSVLGEAGAWPLAAPECAAHPSEACAARNRCLSGAAVCSPADALRGSTGPCARPKESSVAEQPDDAAPVAGSAAHCKSAKGSSAAEQPDAAALAAVAPGTHTVAGGPEAPRPPAQCRAAARGEGCCCSGTTAREAGSADLEAPASSGRAHLAVPGHERASSAGACPGAGAASDLCEACTAAAAAAVHGVALDCSLQKGMPDPAVRSGPSPAGGALPKCDGGVRDPAVPLAGGPHAQEVLLGRESYNGGVRDPAVPRAGGPHAQEVLVGRELYIAGSFINHTCAPNCVLVRGRGWATVMALRPLAVSSAACRHACMRAETG